MRFVFLLSLSSVACFLSCAAAMNYGSGCLGKDGILQEEENGVIINPLSDCGLITADCVQAILDSNNNNSKEALLSYCNGTPSRVFMEYTEDSPSAPGKLLGKLIGGDPQALDKFQIRNAINCRALPNLKATFGENPTEIYTRISADCIRNIHDPWKGMKSNDLAQLYFSCWDALDTKNENLDAKELHGAIELASTDYHYMGFLLGLNRNFKFLKEEHYLAMDVNSLIVLSKSMQSGLTEGIQEAIESSGGDHHLLQLLNELMDKANITLDRIGSYRLENFVSYPAFDLHAFWKLSRKSSFLGLAYDRHIGSTSADVINRLGEAEFKELYSNGFAKLGKFYAEITEERQVSIAKDLKNITPLALADLTDSDLRIIDSIEGNTLVEFLNQSATSNFPVELQNTIARFLPKFSNSHTIVRNSNFLKNLRFASTFNFPELVNISSEEGVRVLAASIDLVLNAQSLDSIDSATYARLSSYDQYSLLSATLNVENGIISSFVNLVAVNVSGNPSKYDHADARLLSRISQSDDFDVNSILLNAKPKSDILSGLLLILSDLDVQKIDSIEFYAVNNVIKSSNWSLTLNVFDRAREKSRTEGDGRFDRVIEQLEREAEYF